MKKHITKIISIITGLAVSAGFISVLVLKINWNEFKTYVHRFDSKSIILALMVMGITMIVNGLRWWILIEKKGNYLRAIGAVILGYAGNMIFPARGGELVKVFYSNKKSGVAAGGLVGSMLLEKVYDFFFAILIGFVALIFKRSGSPMIGATQMLLISITVLVFLFGMLVLLKVGYKQLIKIGEYVFIKLGKLKWYQENIVTRFMDLHEALHYKTLIPVTLYSIFLWFILYPALGYSIALMTSINLSYQEILFIFFMGAIGASVPSAPSGLGVYHAAIVGGFIILGRTSAEGLYYATIAHAFQFLFFTVSGLMYYLSHFKELKLLKVIKK